MTAKINESALFHLLKGKLDSIEINVEPGAHQVGNLEVTFTTPAFAVVTRGEGTAKEKDGYDVKPAFAPAGLDISMAAVLLFLERSEIGSGAKIEKRWADCIRDSLKIDSLPFPTLALAALALVQAEQPPAPAGEPSRTKTQAKRTGAKEVTYTIKRLGKTTVKPKA